MRQQDRKLPLWECEIRVHVFLKMCGKQRTLSLVFLQVWQIEELEPENFDVWQGKNLDAVSVARGREDNDRRLSRSNYL
jgi:hypothetical protein